MLLTLLILFIFLSALFSGSETALTSLPIWRAKKLASKYNLLSIWLSHPYRILTSILVGNTIVNFTISVIITIILSGILPFSRTIEEVLSWMLALSFIFIFGELTPKLYSKTYSQRAVMMFSNLLDAVLKMISPISKAFISFTELFIKEKRDTVSSSILELDEISGISDVKSMTVEKIAMLEKALKIDKVKVSQIMTPAEKIEKVDMDMPYQQIVASITRFGRTRTPVTKDNHFIGYILTRDLLLKLFEKDHNLLDIIRPLLFVKADKKVSELLSDFKKTRIHIAIVLDKHEKVKGLVTLEDVIEEIIGEILDEYDVDKKRYGH